MAFALVAPARADGGPGASSCAALVTVPVELARDVPLIVLAVNGQPVAMVLDTGAERSILVPVAAKRLDLRVHDAYPMAMQGFGGAVSTGEALLSGVSAGKHAIAPLRVRVGSITLPVSGSRPAEGLLGNDVLSDYDIDLDLAHRRVAFYTPGACGRTPPDWPEPRAMIPARRSLFNRLFFDVTLGGRTAAALVDTGSQLSVLDEKAARAMGLTQAALGRDPPVMLHGAGAGGVIAHRHVFDALSVGGETTREFPLLVLPMGLQDADLILGIDYIATRRIWFSWRSRTIWLGTGG